MGQRGSIAEAPERVGHGPIPSFTHPWSVVYSGSLEKWQHLAGKKDRKKRKTNIVPILYV